METTERIVEAYVRHVLGWATIPNIRCPGQNEIDLLAIDPVSLRRSHIEVSISISQGFRKLTAKPFDREKAKERVHQASQRRTVGFFIERKFDATSVVERLREFGFEPGSYSRIIVTWGWDKEAAVQAEAAGIELWDFRTIMEQLADTIRGSSEYFADDTLRTLNLFIHANNEADLSGHAVKKEPSEPPAGEAHQFWVYNNWVHDYATVHRHSCAFCADGRGVHGKGSTANSQWLGPFDDLGVAWHAAKQTSRQDIRRCGICAPDLAR